jgi:putative ABC transport system permease protein
MLEAIGQNIRYTTRSLRASPGFSAVAIVSLSLGIGANTAIFSLIDAVMLKSLPVQHPEELLQVRIDGGPMAYGNPLWEQLRDRQDVFSGIFAYGRWALNLSSGGEARNVNGNFVSGQYFATLGVRAALGRTLTVTDDQRGCPAVAMLGYGFWQREYGGRGDIVGKSISIDNHPVEIVGVTQAGFAGVVVGWEADVIAPLCAGKILYGEIILLDRNTMPGWLLVIGRPKPGISAAQATARLKTLAPAIFKASFQPGQIGSDGYLTRTFDTAPAANGSSYLRSRYGSAMIALMAVVGLVLLIACANLATLLLARGAARQRESAIRMALGSGRGRLIGQFLAESLLLSIIGAAVGVLLARWGTHLFVANFGAFLDLRPDARVLAFTVGVTILTGLLGGLAPAWRGTRVDPQAAMKSNARVSTEGGKFGLGKALVTLQISLALLLVVGAGLMLSTFRKLISIDPGLEPEHVLLVSVDLRNANYPQDRRLLILREMLEKLRSVPGALSASASAIVPMCGCTSTVNLSLEGRSGDEVIVNSFNRVSDRFFETLGIPLIAGRDFTARNTLDSPRVAIINQSLAKNYFGATNPIGKYYRYRENGRLTDPVEIIGVVKDAKYGGLRGDFPATAYAAWSQGGGNGGLVTYFELRYFQLHSAAGPPTALTAGVRSAIAAVDPNVSFQFSTLQGLIDDSLDSERLLATLSSFFGALALLLATMGLYGVMSYNVARRRNEIGIRMALGAEQSRVMRMVLGEMALVVGVGLLLGLCAALAATKLVASFLYGLQPNDPGIFAFATAVLAGVAFVAGYLPARRASRQDPMTALREE